MSGTKPSIDYIHIYLDIISPILFWICYFVGLVVIFQYIFLFNVKGFLNAVYASLCSIVLLLLLSISLSIHIYKNITNKILMISIKAIFVTIFSTAIVLCTLNLFYIGFLCDDCKKNISLETIFCFYYTI